MKKACVCCVGRMVVITSVPQKSLPSAVSKLYCGTDVILYERIFNIVNYLLATFILRFQKKLDDCDHCWYIEPRNREKSLTLI